MNGGVTLDQSIGDVQFGKAKFYKNLILQKGAHRKVVRGKIL